MYFNPMAKTTASNGVIIKNSRLSGKKGLKAEKIYIQMGIRLHIR
jgi:hypothetical protein